MTKCQTKNIQLKKNCFGTKEWSENSGICNRCKLKEECGKANAKGSA